MTTAKQILIIDDDAALRGSLAEQLELHEDFIALQAESGEQALELVKEHHFEVILMDVGLPDTDGRDLCRLMRKQGVKTPVIMLTALSATDDKIDGLDAGADDYLTKPFEFDELLARIRAILRRGEATESKVLTCDTLELDLYTRIAKRDGEEHELSNKEFALLEFLLRNKNRVLSRTQIGEKVWDMNFEPSSNVIDVYISSLRKKIDRNPETPRIHTIKGAGYRFGVMD